jgi:hypothetical protein
VVHFQYFGTQAKHIFYKNDLFSAGIIKHPASAQRAGISHTRSLPIRNTASSIGMPGDHRRFHKDETMLVIRTG